MRHMLFSIVASVLMLGTVPAQAPNRIVPDLGDNPLVITGLLGDEKTLSGSLRLTAQNEDVPAFLFLPSNLKREKGAEEIGRKAITLLGEPTLTAGVPKDYQVSVAGIPQPGTYKGKIEILIQGQPRSSAQVIDITLNARKQITLAPQPGTSPLHLRLVSCGGDCWLARWFLPESAFLNTRHLQLENPEVLDAVLADSVVVALGEKSGYQLTDAQLSLPRDQTFSARQIGGMPLTLHRNKMPPDHYTGSIHLVLEGQAERVTLPLDLSVRSGPLLPLFLLALGIVLGRVFKYMQERGRPQSDALIAVNKLHNRILNAHGEDKTILEPMLQAVRQAVYSEKLDALEAQLKVIESRLDTLAQLRGMEELLKGKEQHDTVKEALEKISHARELVQQERDAEALTVSGEVRVILDGLVSSLMGPNEADQQSSVAEAARMAAKAEEASGKAYDAGHLIPAVAGWRDKARRFLVVATGLSDEIRAEATLWLVRPLLYAALLILLLAVGMNSLYVENGLTFGATPFPDYLGLLLWGLSSDVASRSLSNLQGGKK